MSTKGKDQARNLAFRARYDAFVVGDADGDVHGRLPRKGGVQEMHFSGLRPTHANIATAPDGHLDNTMIELLFLRRGACLRKCEKTLYVVHHKHKRHQHHKHKQSMTTLQHGAAFVE